MTNILKIAESANFLWNSKLSSLNMEKMFLVKLTRRGSAVFGMSALQYTETYVRIHSRFFTVKKKFLQPLKFIVSSVFQIDGRASQGQNVPVWLKHGH